MSKGWQMEICKGNEYNNKQLIIQFLHRLIFLSLLRLMANFVKVETQDRLHHQYFQPLLLVKQEIKQNHLAPNTQIDNFTQFPSQLKIEDIFSRHIKYNSSYPSSYLSRPLNPFTSYYCKKEQQNNNSQKLIKHEPFHDQKIRFKKNSKKGQTKNIPKNYGKQIIKFVKKNKGTVLKILKETNSEVSYQDLNKQLQKKKCKMNKISDLRQLWIQQSKMGVQLRIISQVFMRKYGFSWIFNSRIQDRTSHLKYLSFLQQSLRRPQNFVYLKKLN